MAKSQPTDRRFWAKVEKTEGCWLWTGALDSDGYGNVNRSKKSVGAHRYAYELLVGPIPAGMVLDHICRNRRCVNPAHLDPVTNRENILRGEGACARHARKTHCVHGHEFTPENTRIRPNGSRRCVACVAAYNRRAA